MMKPLNLLSLAAAVLTLCSVPAQAQKTSALPEATSADSADILRFVDVSDTTLAPTGTDKRITIGNLSLSLALNASALTTGTVPTARLASSLQAVVNNSGTLDLSGVTLTLPAGTGGTPAGSGTELQYRNGSAFGAIPGSSWDGTRLYFPGGVNLGGNTNAFSQFGDVQTKGIVLGLSDRTLLGWGASGVFGDAVFAQLDTVLARDSAGVLALRNGINPQAFLISNTYTDFSNWEQTFLGWAGNAFYISSQNAGSGFYRPFRLQAASLQIITGTSSDASSARWQVDSSGHFLAATDNTYDIGANGVSRPRNIYVANYLVTGDGIYSGVAGDSVGMTRRGEVGAANCKMLLFSNATDLFLQLGGDTNSYPALKRSGSDVEIVKAGGTAADTAIILSSPNGTRYRITVSNAGVLTATAL